MTIDPTTTAVLSLDVQEGLLGFVPGAKAAIPAAAQTVAAARRLACRLFHVGLGFEPGYPEIHPRHPRFSMLKERHLFLKGSPSARVHADIFQAGDICIAKHRVSGFAGNALEMILRAQGIQTLVLFGFTTSGIVLSTLRQAADLDYLCLVVKDACFDPDPEVHRVLTDKVFTAQAKVLTAAEFAAMQASPAS
jgi:nicotinamidase-related amidase